MNASARASAVGGRLGVGHRKLDDRLPEHAAQPGGLRLLRDLLLEVVHVREGRGARLDHLERGQPRARRARTPATRACLRPGKMYLFSHSCSARSSASPRSSTIGACVWVLTRPGMITWPAGVDRLGAAELLADGVVGVHRDDVGAVDRHGAVLDDPARAVHGDDGAVVDDERHLPRRLLGGHGGAEQPGRRRRRRRASPEFYRRT